MRPVSYTHLDVYKRQVLKSLEAGLLDFLCERDGRDVFLCWRYGEPTVQYYHELHIGYQGRRPI